MNFQKVFNTIDTHTGGNATRTVISGLPPIIGQTMFEKMNYMKENYDWIRRFLMYEPRGHSIMSGVLLTEPCHPEADVGVIFIETGGYLPMCGHDTIGCCTAIVEAGLIEVTEPYTKLKLDTPAGLVDVSVKVEDGTAIEVTFANVPSFFLKTVTVDLPELGEIESDIVYGGNFYSIINARKYGIELKKEHATEIIRKAIMIRNEINKQEEVIHPENAEISGLTHVQFYEDPLDSTGNVKNTVVAPPGGIDRSPCGTGTSAKIANMYYKNELSINENFIHESIVGSLFNARVLEAVKVADIEGVIPEITGSAWVMGMHSFLYDEADEFKEGYLLIPPVKN